MSIRQILVMSPNQFMGMSQFKPLLVMLVAECKVYLPGVNFLNDKLWDIWRYLFLQETQIFKYLYQGIFNKSCYKKWNGNLLSSRHKHGPIQHISSINMIKDRLFCIVFIWGTPTHENLTIHNFLKKYSPGLMLIGAEF